MTGGKRSGGETGIRTLDTLRYTRFPSVRLQPLGHLSAIQQLTGFRSYEGNTPMNRFTEFTRERQYLQNVPPATVSWYTHAFKWLPSESPTQDELKSVVLRMRE